MASFTDYNSATGSLVGAINGTNAVYTVPVRGQFVEVYKNGILQEQFGADYTWDTNFTITFNVPPEIGSTLTVFVYRQ